MIIKPTGAIKILDFFKMRYLTICFLMSITNPAYAAPNSVVHQDLITIQNAWVRPTSAGQDVGAAYMTLTSRENLEILSVATSVADAVEIHNMTMENGVMKMRMLDQLNLTAGKPYKLDPGGFHLMLFDLKKPLLIGDHVDFVLSVKVKKRREHSKVIKQTIKATVQSSAESKSYNVHTN